MKAATTSCWDASRNKQKENIFCVCVCTAHKMEWDVLVSAEATTEQQSGNKTDP